MKCAEHNRQIRKINKGYECVDCVRGEQNEMRKMRNRNGGRLEETVPEALCRGDGQEREIRAVFENRRHYIREHEEIHIGHPEID